MYTLRWVRRETRHAELGPRLPTTSSESKKAMIADASLCVSCRVDGMEWTLSKIKTPPILLLYPSFQLPPPLLTRQAPVAPPLPRF